jgi:succinoglycan biosynthesis protein ExoA
LPHVSVIVPCYNEQETIGLLLSAIYVQSVPHADMEVIIADGLSTDQTRARIAEFQLQHPDLEIKIVDNPLRIIPSALNRAIVVAQGEYVIRLDAHSIPATDYIARCIAALQAGRGVNVGGAWQIRPSANTWISRAIAAAAAHPLGVGDAFYRLGATARPVDTVPFGAFRRELINHIGLFDESLLTNEDYEFNTRIQESGGVIWFDPNIRSIYFARSTLAALARQYFRYGYWKVQMLRRYPKTLRWRQFLPPVFVACLALLILTSLWWGFARWMLLFQVGVYSFTLLAAGIQLGVKERQLSLIVGVPAAIATMHISWGSAFLWGILSPPSQSKSPGKQ